MEQIITAMAATLLAWNINGYDCILWWCVAMQTLDPKATRWWAFVGVMLSSANPVQPPSWTVFAGALIAGVGWET